MSAREIVKSMEVNMWKEQRNQESEGELTVGDRHEPSSVANFSIWSKYRGNNVRRQ